MNLRKIVLGNKYFYTLWFRFVIQKKNKKLKLPSSDDLFYFDGYPRSGNTYTIGLIERVYPELKGESSHHLHSVGGLKIALEKGLKVIIIIRNPRDAIVSYLFVKSRNNVITERMIAYVIDYYIFFYEYVLQNIEKIKVVNFETIINDGEHTMIDLSKWLNIGRPSKIDMTIEDYKARMVNFQKIQSSKVSSMPNEERRKFKLENLESIVNSKKYKLALNLYNKLS